MRNQFVFQRILRMNKTVSLRRWPYSGFGSKIAAC